jgi:hypothetical protein
MKKEQVSTEEKKARVLKQQKQEGSPHASHSDGSLVSLQKLVGNRAVQRLIQPSSRNQPFELDDDTAARLEKERGGGQALDKPTQEKMGSAMGYDFSDVRVHDSAEADELNQDLGAQAFTTGNDIYFREGAYDPNSTDGQELLSHEMAHVVQQNTGMVGGGSKLRVNAPDDAYEKSADAVAHQVAGSPRAIQAQEMPEEEEVQTRRVQRQEVPEEEEIQARLVQRQEAPEEEELQMQELDEEDAKKAELEGKKISEQEEELQPGKVK